MDSARASNNSEALSVVDIKDVFPVMDDGTYEADYDGLGVFKENTPWGEKKRVRLYFKVTRGKYRGAKASYRGDFVKDPDTEDWVVGSRTELAKAIRAITGGKKLDETFKGTHVFIEIKNKKKKNGDPFTYVERVIARPKDDASEQPEQQQVSTAAAQAATVAAAAPQQAAAPAQAAPKVQPKSEAGDSLMNDLESFADFDTK